MRMPGVAQGAAARALPLCVTGDVLRWAVDTAGRPPQQSSTGALARADSAYSVSDKNWRSSEVILPRAGRANAWCGTGCRCPGLAVTASRRRASMGVDTAGRPQQPFWLKRLLLRSGSTVSKATHAGAARDGHRPSPAVTRRVLDGGEHAAALRPDEIRGIRRDF